MHLTLSTEEGVSTLLTHYLSDSPQSTATLGSGGHTTALAGGATPQGASRQYPAYKPFSDGTQHFPCHLSCMGRSAWKSGTGAQLLPNTLAYKCSRRRAYYQALKTHPLLRQIPTSNRSHQRHLDLLEHTLSRRGTGLRDEFPRRIRRRGSGISPTHLKELLRLPEASDDADLLPAHAALVTQLDRGAVPDAIILWLTGVLLTLLRRTDSGVRPISVGETLRRLTSVWLNRKVRTTVESIL